MIQIFDNLFFPSVSESKDLKGPVATVIERELKTLLDCKDLKQFNSDFLEQNSQSLLHRLSGKAELQKYPMWSSGHRGSRFSRRASDFHTHLLSKGGPRR